MIYPNYALGIAVSNANNWWHNGSLPGTTAEIVRTANEINWAILFNTRTQNPNDINVATDNLVWNVLPNITSWPLPDLFVGVEEYFGDNSISCYPNPANDRLFIHVQGNLPESTLDIINLQGTVVKRVFGFRNDEEVSTKEFASGLYFLKIYSGARIIKQKVLIQH